MGYLYNLIDIQFQLNLKTDKANDVLDKQFMGYNYLLDAQIL